MQLYPTEEETIVGTTRAIRAGKISCVDVVNRCLANIKAREHEVKAWVSVDHEGARNQAYVLDQELANGQDRGPLHGIPFGIKDIINVAGWPTEAGFEPFANRIAGEDAPLVADLRRAGAIILGKTVTTAFAWIDPSITRNPWNLEHTPGGSSSGSAAAVACGMCLGAIGTQTGGSVIRPASFCGVVGFKPTHGSLSTKGMVPFARSLDTPGFFARSVNDVYVTYRQLLTNQLHESPGGKHFGPMEWELPSRQPKQVGIAPEVILEHSDPAMKTALELGYKSLASSGVELKDFEYPFSFEELHPVHRTIMAVEAAEAHESTLSIHRDRLPPKIRAIWEQGLEVRGIQYVRAINRRDLWRQEFFFMSSYRASAPEFLELLLMPAAIGAAPDPSSTGDPWMNSPWTMMGNAVITIPAALDPRTLPLGIQIVASLKSDLAGLDDPTTIKALFAEAHWVEQTIRQSLGY